MSKKQQDNKKDTFSYTPLYTLPTLKTYKTKWDLATLYYKNENDPQIEKDIVRTERVFQAFAKKWSQTPFTENTSTLFHALSEYEHLQGLAHVTRPARYFSFRSVLNVNDDIAQKRLALLAKRLRICSDKLLFFPLTLGVLPKDVQRKLLETKELSHFRYYLERLFLGAKHHLSEPEEKIINLKASQSSSRWVDMTEKIVSNRTILWQGKKLPVPEALEQIEREPTQKKKELWKLLMHEMKQIGEVAEHEFNALITDVRTEDTIRKYKKPYSATALAYEDTEKSIENVVHAVSTKGFKLSRKFYTIKAKLHGVKQLHYSQKYISLGSAPELPFEQAVTICRDVFYRVKSEYGEIFDRMLTRGQIDVFPTKGKRGGAFMSDETGHPVHVLLNHLSTFKSLETLAHEMGHAIHAHKSAKNSPFYDGHSITTAETASTLFENLVFDAVFEQATKTQQKILLHDRIARDIATIQRQIAFFNCELEMHTTISKEGGMSNKELAQCMQKHLQSYLGPAVEVSELDGYSYAYIPHLRYGFYVYTYAFGMLMSTLMAKNYKKDNAYVEKIDQFLSAGQSDTVANIFRSIGLATNTQKTFEDALITLEKDISTFASLAK